ncbi:hypothetical protein BGZ95_010282 [Linnemannia exigua]|uniref:Uncharacterized protein n=1 Tax=Linnemannia exigua TaxID=604196 RepID=A0AAD4DBV3_9FUNG|nr:hypothetical protein BGZ95_010282 [Linnemannia exigua]
MADSEGQQPTSPPPLPKRCPDSLATASEAEPYNLTPGRAPHQASVDDSYLAPTTFPDSSLTSPPPLPKRQQPPVIVTPPRGPAAGGSGGATSTQGAYPDRTVSTNLPLSTSGQSTPTMLTTHSNQSASALSQKEVSFQFDRHVQEIRRRRTVLKKAPPPDREDFTRVEAESGKRVLDVSLYVQAHLMYFVESLARDEKVKKMEPLQWSRIKTLLSRLYDTSSPAQSLGLYVERVMYWRNPPETFAWFTLYITLWAYQLWLPGFIFLFVLKILNNRFGFLGNFKKALNVPDPMTVGSNGKEPMRKSSKMHSQLRELIHSKDLTDWISQMTKIWGPYCQALLEENICYLERLKNLFRWERPQQTWRVLGLLAYYILVTTFFPFVIVPAIGFFIGLEFFVLLPCQKYYPRFSHVFSPVEWILWGVPTNADLAVEMLTRQEDERRRSMEEAEPSIGNVAEPFTHGEEEINDSASYMSGLSPASKIKYEYQKRARKRSDSSGSGSILEMQNMDSSHDKNEFHCLLRGKPGKLVITEDALQFRSVKLLGHEVENQIYWEDIDSIKKSKSINLGIWSMPGIDVTDINGRVTTFHNVVKRDDAFRKLVVTSGKKWSNVS